MPWQSDDAYRHTHKAESPKAQRQWAHVADSALSRGASEGSAIRQANSVVAHRHAMGGEVSPLAGSLMRSSYPKLGSPMGTAGHMRMPHVPLMNTMHNIDQHMAGAKVKLPKLQAKLSTPGFAQGGVTQTLSPHALAAIRTAVSHLTNKDASTAAATLRANTEAMQHPVVRAAAQALRNSVGIGPATQRLSALQSPSTQSTPWSAQFA